LVVAGTGAVSVRFQAGRKKVQKQKKFTNGLTTFFIVLSLAAPLLAATVVKADAVVEIRNWHDLHAVRDNLAGSYVLMNDLDATTAGYLELASEAASEGKGWQPIGVYREGESFEPFTGTFDGQGYEIRDLYINRPEGTGVGLFCAVVAEGRGGVIKNVRVVNVQVTGGSNVGGLAGFNSGNIRDAYCIGEVAGNSSVAGLVGLNAGNISNSQSSTSTTGMWFVGGLVGYNMEGAISGCHASGPVTGDILIGGLVGYNERGTVSNSRSDASITGKQGVGGLVGANGEGTVHNSYATSSVTGDDYVGGLVGHNWGQYQEGIVSNCYAVGRANGNQLIGGLVGYNDLKGTVRSSYAAGNVSGDNSIGGLVGYNRGTVRDCYARGSVTGNASVGGLVGANDNIVKNSFWDRETSGIQTGSAGVGKTTREMMNIATFTDTRTEGLDRPWDIIAVTDGFTNDAYAWNIVAGKGYPFLSGKQFIACDLNIAGTTGGSVIIPGEGAYSYAAGEVVDLVAKADKGYRFVAWSGDVEGIADVTAAQTTITMNSSYTIIPNFEKMSPQPRWPLIAAIVAAVIAIRALLFLVPRPKKKR